MIKKRKKLFYLIVTIAVITSTFSLSFGESIIIHEREMENIVSSGVLHENIQKFTSDGWWNINVLRVDLGNEYTEIKPIFSNQGIGKREKLSNMVKEHNAIAGINGDFFASFNYSSPLGIVVSNGKLISTTTEREDNLPTLTIDNNNQAMLNYWTTVIKVITGENKTIDIKSKNKASSTYNEIRLYDKNWSKKTFGNTLFKDMVEIIIEDNIVVDVRDGQAEVDMPLNGYILAGAGDARNILLDNFRVGDIVKLNETSFPDYENIKAALGGGAVIVREGKPVRNLNDINISGDQPRTAIGITSDRGQLLLVTLDGRHTSYKGVSQEVLSQIMIDLGAYEAINLDGGGSTTMVINSMGNNKPTIINNPSDGGERAVINGLGIFNNAPLNPVEFIKISTNDTKVFEGTSREFSIKGFDRYHNPVNVNMDEVIFEVEAQYGSFLGNILKAKASGIATVKANYQGKTAEIKINILDGLKDIENDLDEIHADFNSIKSLGDFYGINDEGFTAKIDNRDIIWKVVGDIGRVENSNFYSGNKVTSGYLTASVGNSIENILVSVGYNESLIHNFEDITDIGFTTYPQEVLGLISSGFGKVGNNSLNLYYDFTQTEATRAAYILLGNQGITLEGKPEKIGMWVNGNNSEHWLRGKLVDSQGTSYTIDFAKSVNWNDWKWVTANIPSNVSYPVKLERIYLVGTDPTKKDAGFIMIDELTSLFATPINSNMDVPKDTKISDPLMRKSELAQGGYRFSIVNGIKDANTLLKNNIGNRITDTINSTDFGLIFGSPNNEYSARIVKPNLKVNGGYGSVSHKNTLFIKLDNSKDGLRATDYRQWIWLKDKLNNPLEKNIVISFSKDAFKDYGFIDKLEAQLLDELILSLREKGKNVFVVSEGQKTEVQVKSGIRYIKLNKIRGDNFSEILSTDYINFTVNGNDISYEILPLYKIKN